ncbi:MAG: DMT family transporter [Rhodobacteraceae bacterium]|nr:DMT family transporter [Paracoccaceae bacterium]
MPQPSQNSFIPGPGPTALPVPPSEERDNWRGLVWMAVSVVGSSTMTVAIRAVALELDSRLVVLFRSGITVLLIIAALILVSPLRRKLSFSKPWRHVVRGIFVALATQLGFYTIATIPLATATVLMFTAPIFATILGMVLHGEKIGPRRIAAICIGFLGALVVLRPGFNSIELGMITAIASSLCFAIALSMSRNLAQADGPLSTYFSSVVFTALFALPLATPVWQVPVLPVTWIAIAILVVSGAVRGWADIEAYRHAEAAVLAPLAYMRLVLVGIAGYFLFAETPDTATLVGAAIIIGATFYIARREAALRKTQVRTVNPPQT